MRGMKKFGIIFILVFIVGMFVAHGRKSVFSDTPVKEAAPASKAESTNVNDEYAIMRTLISTGGKSVDNAISIIGEPATQDADKISYKGNDGGYVFIGLEDGCVSRIQIIGATAMTYVSEEWFWESLKITPNGNMDIVANTDEAYRCTNVTDEISEIWIMYNESTRQITQFDIKFVI